MAWISSGSTNNELIRNLRNNGVIKSSVVVDAMQKVDRADYTSTGMPYADTPNTIGYGQTISAPHMHGQALEDLHQKATIPNAKILDVGSGSGYLSACFARLNPSAKVIGIDCINDLVKQSIVNMKRHDSDLLESGRVVLKQGDGWLGLPGEGPFDVIHVGAAAEEIPSTLLSQLRLGGQMMIPVGPRHGAQTLMLITREAENNDGNDFRMQNVVAVQFVPLVRGGG